jgi:hypothetical protein
VRSPVADLLADLSRAFTALDIRWYLFGAQAAIEGALGQSDLLPAFEKALRRSRG